jgi:hypothetical protein
MQPVEQEITELWGHITAATYRFLELIGEFDRSGRWADWGIASCAHWLNIYCGIGQVAAREKLRVAHGLAELPKIREAFRDGRVSYSKVRAMTRAATPENEAILLNIAIHGTASHVERTVRYYRRVERIEDAAQAAATHRDRFVDFRYDDDEHVVIQGRLPVEVGELVRKAIERAMAMADSAAGQDNSGPAQKLAAWRNRHDVSAETIDPVAAAVPEDRYPFGARRADGLRLLAEQFLAGESAPSGVSAAPYQVVVHVDQRLLSGAQPARDDAARPMLCELEDGPTLAAETARRLACDGALVGIVDAANGEPLNVGRKTRAIPPALRRALKARDKGCRFPGCTHTRFTEGHHVQHWADGGETKLSNLITLCHFHHHLIHEGGFGLTRTDDGVFVFTQPQGERLPEYVAVAGCFRGNRLADLNRGRDIEIRPNTVVTRWLGETLDYSMAIDGLLAAKRRRAAAHDFG